MGKLSSKLQAVINAVFFVLSIFIFVVLAWQYVRQAVEAIETGEASVRHDLAHVALLSGDIGGLRADGAGSGDSVFGQSRTIFDLL